VEVARQKLALVGRPTSADRTAAHLDLRKAQADLETLTRAPSQTALDAAQLAIDAATQKLAQLNGPPSPAEITTIQQELKKAEAELEAMLQAPPQPSAAAIAAAELAVKLAKQRLAEITGWPPSEQLAAQLELAKAQADLEALLKAPTRPSATAIAAAQLAIDLAKQKLTQLNGAPSQAALTAAQLELKKAQLELETLRRRPTATAVDAARLAVTLAKRRLALLTHPTAAVLDGARLDVQKARVDLETLRRRGAPAGPIDLALAQLKVTVGEQRLALASTQERRLTVAAPLPGTVTDALVAQGSSVDLATPIVRILDLGRLLVNLDLSEFDVAKIRTGDEALVSVDAFGGKTLRGRVTSIALIGANNNGVVTFPVTVALRAANGLRAGMTVSVRVVAARRHAVVRIPLEAANGSTVTVLTPTGKTTERYVVLGLSNNTYVEVRSGLRPGERVVLNRQGGG
jgi:HlyD family secretion protein